MGYSGGSLTSLFSEANTRPATDRMLRRVAQDAGEQITSRARAMTPVDTGALASAWAPIPSRQVAPGTWESGATNQHYTALWVELGVEPHEIRPKRAKAIGTPEGPRAGADHPGSVGAFMLARALAEVAAELPAIAAPALNGWAREVERGAD